MRLRAFGGDSVRVSEVGLGCWQLGGDQWGDISDDVALSTLRAAVDAGTTFLDTADVYGAGRSEELVGRFLKEKPRNLFVATKLGRFSTPGLPENCTPENMRTHTENSLKRLGVENGNAVKALDSVAEHLATPHGIVLQQPALQWLLKKW